MRDDEDDTAITADPGFVLDEAGRMLRVNAPDAPPAPRFWIAGSAKGNHFLFRYDVAHDIEDEITPLARSEPPLANSDGIAIHLDRYTKLLARQAPVPATRSHSTMCSRITDSPLRHSRGDALVARFESSGMPEGLSGMGFKNTGELRAPWCIVMDGDEPASIAFAARLSARRAGLGLATAPAFRRRGFAAAATAAWTQHPALANRSLSYTHNRDNRSSKRVTERLRLRFKGLSLAIP